MNILFTGGGTAGHVSPAIAMAEIIKRKYPDASFSFIGRVSGEENKAAERAGFSIHTLDVEGISRRLTPRNLLALTKAVCAVGKAKRIIRSEGARMVIGTGGYVCWPVLRAAASMGMPSLIHESNAYPGLVTRSLAARCDAVMLGTDAARDHLGRAKALYTVGNPVLSEFGAVSRQEARRKLGIPEGTMLTVSFGGSLGAERLNEAVIGMMKETERKRPAITHVHATGRRFYDGIREAFPELCRSTGSRITPYLEDMPLWLAAADLAITRSGAMTLAELSASGCPAILIPSPNVADDHQTKNAKAMERIGAAYVIPEERLSDRELSLKIGELYKNKGILLAMKSAASASFEKPDAKILNVFDAYYPF